MKISSTSRTWKFRSLAGRIMTGVVFAAMIGSISVLPALGDDDHGRRGRHDNGRYEHRERGHERGGRYVHGRRVYQSHGYREGYYSPPPVIYVPPPEPGISIFFPIR
jgi:hypothetical protein